MAPFKLRTEACIATLLVLLPRGSFAAFRALCTPFDPAFMDPIVSPGRRSAHMHHIAGSLGFNADKINAAWLKGNTTSCNMLNDFSVYWAPSMYNISTGTPLLMKPTMIGAYYQYSPEDLPYFDLDAMSQPLLMIVGRSSGWTQADNYMDRRVLYMYRTMDAGILTDHPSDRQGWNSIASDAIEVLIHYFFPSCWNGGPYVADQSHVVYPDPQTNRCPATHPRQFPAIRIEQKYSFDTPIAWASLADVPFTLASGNETTAHADAIIFWDAQQVAELYAQCNDTLPAFCDGGLRQTGPEADAAAASYHVPDQYWNGTRSPTPSPTPAPTLMPTLMPTVKPTKSPTMEPTNKPTKAPSAAPTPKPSSQPTRSPTRVPTSTPTTKPTYLTSRPTQKPTRSPTARPTDKPTKSPTTAPSPKPTSRPTLSPTRKPTATPTGKPTRHPTAAPSFKPTYKTSKPTAKPTKVPTTAKPTRMPTA